MKKLISLLLVFMFLISGCEKAPEEVQIETPSESSQIPESGETSSEEEILKEQNPSFYPAKAYEGDGSLEHQNRAPFNWNEDGTLTFQNENTLVTLSKYNEVIKTLTLPKEYLPKDEFTLFWNEKYIIAFAKAEEDKIYTAFYETSKGNVYLVNATVFDAEGNPITQYRVMEVDFYSGNYNLSEYSLPHSPGEDLKYVTAALSANYMTWLNENQFIINAGNNILLFDVEAEKGRRLFDENYVLWEGNFFEGHEGATDGYYYTLGASQNSRSTVCMFDSNGYKYPLTGEYKYPIKQLEANILEVGDGFVMASDTENETYNEIIYWAKAGETEFETLTNEARGWPKTFGKYIWWQTMYKYGPKENAFYVFNTETGEKTVYKSGYEGYQLLHKVIPEGEGFKFYYEEHDAENNSSFWVYNSNTQEKTEIPYEFGNRVLYIYEDYISPDGKLFVEYDDYTSFTNLRVAKLEP